MKEINFPTTVQIMNDKLEFHISIGYEPTQRTEKDNIHYIGYKNNVHTK